MMTPEIRELIARAVDGSLTATDRKRVEHVLKESPQARALFSQLKKDAQALRSLTFVVAPVNIADAVTDLIRERNLTPTPTPPRPKTSGLNWPSITFWLNVSTAAGIMFTIAIGSYMYIASLHSPQRPHETSLAREQQRKTPSAANQQALPSRPETPEEYDDPIPESVVNVPSPEITPVRPELGPIPRIIDAPLTAPVRDMMPEIHAINIAKHRVSRFVNLADLISTDPAQQKNHTEIRSELKADELIRLDLFCRDPKVAMDMLATVLKNRGCQSVTDQHLLERFKKKQTAEIVFFTDVLTPEEVFQLLGQIAQADKKSTGGEGQFDTLVIAPFLPADLDMLGRILGAGSAMSKTPKPKTPVDIRKPLPEGTANHLAQSLSKMGSGSSSTLKNEKLAFVGSYSPVNPTPSQSKEIKSYLERRADKRTDAKPLMLVLRTVN
ncbi:anti-sigma factor family protein [Zavarzinella formosa]|uniref:anti-sigma factor family protein n=1 Tax=Zavarzinella formosa TaxID=360055 RepID=UPI0002E6C7DF|nr:hypothetical protein [Zavarzinella formosa]